MRKKLHPAVVIAMLAGAVAMIGGVIAMGLRVPEGPNHLDMIKPGAPPMHAMVGGGGGYQAPKPDKPETGSKPDKSKSGKSGTK
jgi:hypothetical protein